MPRWARRPGLVRKWGSCSSHVGPGPQRRTQAAACCVCVCFCVVVPLLGHSQVVIHRRRSPPPGMCDWHQRLGGKPPRSLGSRVWVCGRRRGSPGGGGRRVCVKYSQCISHHRSPLPLGLLLLRVWCRPDQRPCPLRQRRGRRAVPVAARGLEQRQGLWPQVGEARVAHRFHCGLQGRSKGGTEAGRVYASLRRLARAPKAAVQVPATATPL